MKKLINMKLLPTTNPNYTVKESTEELIELFKENVIYIINDNNKIIGFTKINDGFYEEDGFICGSILSNENSIDHNYEWFNAEVMNGLTQK